MIPICTKINDVSVFILMHNAGVFVQLQAAREAKSAVLMTQFQCTV
jgi:hypothetical protein